MATESPQLARVREARSALLLTHPFFGVLSLRLQLVESGAIPTAGVDGKRLIFNPAFIDTLTQAELKGVTAHEVMHCALLHHARMGERDAEKWNIACDGALNPLLLSDGFTLPRDAVTPATLTQRLKLPDTTGMSAEQIYNLLPNPPSGSCKGKMQQLADALANLFGQAQGATGDFSPAGPADSAEAESQAREWQENVQSAIRAAQSQGKLPAHIQRALGATVSPRADWKTLLRRFMTEQTRVRPTWSRPNKRFRHRGLYLPGAIKEGMGAIAVGVDTSGSITDETLAAFAAEVRAIATDAMPSAIHVVYCDAEVNHVDTFENGEDVVISPHGGGGTDFRPVFDRIEEEGWPVVCAVYLTDTDGTFPDTQPDYPVMWATYGAGENKVPWGEQIAVDG